MQVLKRRRIGLLCLRSQSSNNFRSEERKQRKTLPHTLCFSSVCMRVRVRGKLASVVPLILWKRPTPALYSSHCEKAQHAFDENNAQSIFRVCYKFYSAFPNFHSLIWTEPVVWFHSHFVGIRFLFSWLPLIWSNPRAPPLLLKRLRPLRMLALSCAKRCVSVPIWLHHRPLLLIIPLKRRRTLLLCHRRRRLRWLNRSVGGESGVVLLGRMSS